jgi:hypothetical protein
MSSEQPRNEEPYRVASLDAIAAIPIPAGLAWRPIRGALGVRAFGVAGFTADEAGQDVVEPHTESEDGRGHQELYLVARGAARFTLDGEEFDAPAGTLVFVRDPSVHRHGVAVEAGTEVLAFGGDPVFQPGARTSSRPPLQGHGTASSVRLAAPLPIS